MPNPTSVTSTFKHFFVKGEGIDKGFVVLIFLFVIILGFISRLNQLYQLIGFIAIAFLSIISYWVYASKKQKGTAVREVEEEYEKGRISKRSYYEELKELK